MKQVVTQIMASMDMSVSSVVCNKDKSFLLMQEARTGMVLEIDANQLPVIEQHTFYGLASYYNSIRILNVTGKEVSSLNRDESVRLDDDGLIAAAGRFSVLLFKAPGATATVENNQIRLSWPQGIPAELTIILSEKSGLHALNPSLSSIQYSHLWDWLASLSRAVEWSLVKIQSSLAINWGWSIVIFAILLKVLLLPVSLMTVHFQRQVSKNQSILAPQLAEIKSQFDGEQAHERIMAAHKALGVTPFYTLKPMLGSFIQIPILVATFNALGEMPQLAGNPFLWIGDLAYPDVVATLPITIPMFGDKFSLLPFVMTIVTLFSTVIFQNRLAPEIELKRQKRNLYLMSAAFFILFYPFPAAMVLYWTLANILQTIQQQLIRI
jgi:YidC/Oxa1 family membrane protein insertase